MSWQFHKKFSRYAFENCYFNTTSSRGHWVDSFWPSDAIWLQKSWSTLAQVMERERERFKFISLFGDRGHRGPYSPYKPLNHNLYIGTSNGSWCIGIKGEMSGTVCVTFTWDIYIYIWVVYSFCFFCCLFIIVTWWYMWCIVWQVASKRKYRHVW